MVLYIISTTSSLAESKIPTVGLRLISLKISLSEIPDMFTTDGLL